MVLRTRILGTYRALVAGSAAALLLATGSTAHATTVFDGFDDGAITLQPGETGGNYEAPSVPGGRRTVGYAANQTGTLQIDTTQQTLSITGSTKTVDVRLGYGYATTDGGSVHNSYDHRLDADWTAYDAIRIPLLVNTGWVSIRIQVGTQRLSSEPGGAYDGESAIQSVSFTDGWTGDIDISFDSFTQYGGFSDPVDWADVDRVYISIGTSRARTSFTVGPIQLIPEPTTAALLAVGTMVLTLRRRQRTH